jgi:high-affinity iron transporter
MLNIFTIVLRESLEAVLIVGLIIAILGKQGLLKPGKFYVMGGVISGILLSCLLASAIYRLSDWLNGAGLIYFEVALFLLSAGLMTHMVFWMRQIGKRMKVILEGDLARSMTRMGLVGVAVVSALAIGREGAETAIYLYSLSLSNLIPMGELLIASLLALAVALGIGICFIRGIKLFNLNAFFNVTSGFLLITAGALLLQSVYRLVEIGILPALIDNVWDTSNIIPSDSWSGSLLSFFAGYVPNPSLMAVLIYAAYWAGIAGLFAFEGRPAVPMIKSRASAS